jgi:hypothetical protein
MIEKSGVLSLNQSYTSAASRTIAFVPYLLQNVLPWSAWVAHYPQSTR